MRSAAKGRVSAAARSRTESMAAHDIKRACRAGSSQQPRGAIDIEADGKARSPRAGR
jgi:hypothetical protein